MDNDFWVLLFDGNNWIPYASSESRIQAENYATLAKETYPNGVVVIALKLKQL